MTIEELRVLITAKTESLQDGINKATSKLKGFKRTSEDTSSTINKNVQNMKNQYDQLIKKLDNVNAQAELQQKKLAQLREKYSRISTIGQDSPKAMKLQDQVLKAESRLHNLIATSDKTVAKITELEDKMNIVGITTEKSSSRFKTLRDRLQQIKDKFRQTGNEIDRSTGKVAGFANMLNRSFMRVLKRIFIYNLIYKAIRGLINYMGGALKTNNQFVASLNTIKTNLRVAFQPIYDFILPALNSLMNALATITTYIASFTSALFGKTYKQSYDAAKGLEKAKKAMDGYGSSAKKAKGQLAGFDEINVLNTKEDSGGGSNDFEMEMPDLTQIDEGPISRLQQRLAEIFKPFKDAWDSEGKNTINSARNAFESVKTLIGEIGNSFKEVWTGGSGQEILENLLRIFQQISDLVRNIADSFRIAWTENETGTEIIQGVADIFNIVLGIVESIGESLNNVWGEVGQTVVNTFMSILESTIDAFRAVAEGLREIWERGGKHLFESLIELGAKIFEIAGFIYTEFVAPFVIWFVDLISPAIGTVLDWIGKLVDGLIWLLDEFLKLLKGIKEGKLGEFFVGLWDGIKKKTEDTWNAIKTFLVDTIWNPIKSSANTVWQGISKHIVEPIEKVWGSLKDIWDRTKKYILDKWDEIRIGISSKKDDLINAIKEPFVKAKEWIDELISDAKNWGKNLISNITEGMKSMADKVKKAATSTADKIAARLGFGSPTKEGPGATADRWMPNLMNMLADGIKDNIYKIDASVDMAATSLSGISRVDDSNAIASAVGSAVMAALQMGNSSNSNNNNSSGEVAIYLDGRKVGRGILNYMNDELERLGYKTLFQVE
ncbi:hypothetical protein [Tissierella sp. Yu-01]|uniref:phage tail protein n=1 Tax=Tissierella sp. Yu-01 TaxID=3035694 RepID=UPI00240E8C00|nr:hypothetical protein [Tissierella sp. Yu-01]WFA10328.1 hypothetical protein P3962_07190 [Tissierella sp. Yu-01]